MSDQTQFDFAVIGAGLVGSAIARELAGTNMSVILVEAKNDVGDGTSKASTSILHTGFDATPGTLESKLVSRGYELWRSYIRETGIALDDVGAILVAWTQEEVDTLPKLADKAVANGYLATKIINANQVYAAIPKLGPGALAGLVVPGESIIDSWSALIAVATDAVNRGATLKLNSKVTGVEVLPDKTILKTTSGNIGASWVINAAGLGGDYIDGMYGYQRFKLNPRKGELLVFDKLTRPMVPVIVLPVPSKVGKGVLVSPTVYGNVMLGPTAEDLEDREDAGTSEKGFEFLFEKGQKLMPSLMAEEVTTAYAGLRAAHDQSDYVIECDTDQRYIVAGCIRSTGLTSSPAIAEYVMQMLTNVGLELSSRPDLPKPPRVPYLGESGVRPYQDEKLIAQDSKYGEIICFCERVTAGEIRDAVSAVLPATTLGGLRRRTRAQNGRCQGFYCGSHLQELLAKSISEKK